MTVLGTERTKASCRNLQNRKKGRLERQATNPIRRRIRPKNRRQRLFLAAHVCCLPSARSSSSSTGFLCGALARRSSYSLHLFGLPSLGFQQPLTIGFDIARA